MLEDIVDMVKALSFESSDRHWKINKMTECVESMEDDYFGLKQRIQLLKAYGKDKFDKGICPKPSPAFTDLKECVVKLSDTVKEVEGYLHPCGGTGWRQVVNLDISDPNQDCPAPWIVSPSTSTKPRGCLQNPNSPVSFPVPDSEPYTEVCGLVQGFPFGQTGGFANVLQATPVPTTVNDYVPLVRGVVITSGDDHVWTFAAGIQPLDTFASMPALSNYCPCLFGEDQFFIDVGATLPAIVGADYFCDSRPSNAYFSGASTTLSDIILWDGLNCDEPTECCNDGTPPVFYKVLSSATSDPIIVSATNEVLKMSIYIR